MLVTQPPWPPGVVTRWRSTVARAAGSSIWLRASTLVTLLREAGSMQARSAGGFCAAPAAAHKARHPAAARS